MWPLDCNASKIYIAMAVDINPLMKMLHKVTLERLLKAVTSLKNKQTDSLSHGISLVKQRDAAMWWINTANPRDNCRPSPRAELCRYNGSTWCCPVAAPTLAGHEYSSGSLPVAQGLCVQEALARNLCEEMIYHTVLDVLLTNYFWNRKKKIHIIYYCFYVLKLW